MSLGNVPRPGKQKNSNIVSTYRYRDFLHPRFWPTWLGIGFLQGVARLPFIVQKALAKGLAKLLFKVASSRRKVALTNITLCFPELTRSEQVALTKKTFYSYTLGLIETARAWCIQDSQLKQRVEGIEHLQAAQADPRGVLLLSGHFGPLDIAGVALAKYAQYSVTYRNDDNPLFNYFMVKGRQKFVHRTIARKDMRGLLGAFKRGEIIWYAPDQDYGRKVSVFAPFFGIPTATVTMTGKLASSGNAIVLPLSSYRDDDDQTIVLKFEAPLEIPSGDNVGDAHRVNAWLESCIRRHPDQYLWLHKRFKTRPEGEPSVYK
ncbi:LpxL/LpxP family Kdo(2)-lipid IV(A) lauroyl/palmitoleoyl acyltransferase [Reinekea marina]|uniref:Lipid A biosynthesis acyltransferase n=1 Tax=Reinekea marina TaxID=1310421 RepID=A0ABV7WRN7_9GAMM|nr:LpxL/LpxP family Kdo(2)-lipid IV(A) lauroyl/palmitoleoyl acyltransferase [Reinekea marina]MDN3650849.1 LpxL/LpxP family Kdo(2)-lipid IV(A) lauroyl/palmitoleoyl acyltransferase [Reinekea marina]